MVPARNARRVQTRRRGLGPGPDDSDQQTERRHREDRGSDTAERPKDQQLNVVLSERARSGRHRDDQQTGQVDRTLAESLHQMNHWHGANSNRINANMLTIVDGGRRPDAELNGEQRQRRRHDPEAEGNHETRGDQNPDLPPERVGRVFAGRSVGRARSRSGQTRTTPARAQRTAPRPGACPRGTTPRRSCRRSPFRTASPRTTRSRWSP